MADLPLQELDLTGALPEPEVLAESAVWATVQTVRATHAIAAARALALAMPPKLESVELFVEPDDVTEVYEGLVIPQGTTVRLTGTRPPVALRQAMLARAPDIRMPAPAEEPDPGEVMTRLEAALAAHVPAVALRPGATDAAIDALEAEIGQKLPESLRAIYRLHDGQGDRDTLPGLFFGMPWLPLEAMTATWREWEGLVDEELHLELSSHPPGAIQLGYARRGWLPISEDFSGNLLAVDLAPGPEGWRGQLINAGRDEHDKHVLARSLPEFLARVCEEIEAGRVHFGEEHLYSTERESRHFLDVVPHVAAQWRGSP